jgi:hypothetical protein
MRGVANFAVYTDGSAQQAIFSGSIIGPGTTSYGSRRPASRIFLPLRRTSDDDDRAVRG